MRISIPTRAKRAVTRWAWLVLLAPAAFTAWAATEGLAVRRAIDPALMRHDGGLAFSVAVTDLAASIPLLPVAEELAPTRVFEEGLKLGPARRSQQWISEHGLGAYAHREGRVHFSSSDGSDPRTNGRAYHARLRRYAPAWFAGCWVGLLLVAAGIAAGARLRSSRREKQRRGRSQAGPRWPVDTRALARRLGASTLAIALAILVGSLLEEVRGAVFWLVAALSAAGFASAIPLAWPGGRRAAIRTLLALASIGVTLAVTELVLEVHARRLLERLEATDESDGLEPSSAAPSFGEKVSDPRDALPKAVRARVAARRALLTMPAEWAQRPVEVPGARKALYWHGVLHLLDVNEMRRSEPFPPKEPGRLRIAVLGDSLTYGWGIESEWSYPSQLERTLAPEYDVEVLNMGAPGHASEDVLGAARRLLPRLDPDLVIYGVCLNDFLPSGRGQYDHREAYAFPIPESWKTRARDRTRVAGIVATGYDRLLRRLGLRVDFYDDILRDFGDYRRRFGRDVAELNALVLERGLPPVVALVLDQAPQAGGRGQRVARIAERLLEEAGMSVVPSDPFYRRYDGATFAVSRWEGHPNEEALAIFAAMLAEDLRGRGLLEAARRVD